MDRIALLRAAPERTALLFDVDGTLAPIVPRPEDAQVPEETREELRRLAGRYALVACVTGRTADVARGILGVDELRVIGEHGLELDPESEEWAHRIHSFADAADWPAERKRLSVSFHWREHPEAQPVIERIAAAGEEAGFRVRWGRKVIDVIPPVDADKGTAIRFLLDQHPDVTRALFAGDDTTDVEGFRGLRESGADPAVCVAVVGPGSPAALQEGADLTVDGPEGLVELMRSL